MTWWIITLASAALLMVGGWKLETERGRTAWLVVWLVLAVAGALGVVVGSYVLWLRTGVFG